MIETFAVTLENPKILLSRGNDIVTRLEEALCQQLGCQRLLRWAIVSAANDQNPQNCQNCVVEGAYWL